MATILLVVAYLVFEQNDVDGHHRDVSSEDMPAYRDWIPDEGIVDVTTDSTSPDELREVFDAVRAERTDQDWWQVRISCASVPELPSVDSRLATGRFANTLRGAEEAGLESAQDITFTTTGLTECDPLPAPDGAITAEDVFVAVEREGLAVTDPRDGTDLCHQLTCLQRTETDQFTVIVWPTPEAASSSASRPMLEIVLLDPVTTVQIEDAGFGADDERDAYRDAVATATPGLARG